MRIIFHSLNVLISDERPRTGAISPRGAEDMLDQVWRRESDVPRGKDSFDGRVLLVPVVLVVVVV